MDYFFAERSITDLPSIRRPATAPLKILFVFREPLFSDAVPSALRGLAPHSAVEIDAYIAAKENKSSEPGPDGEQVRMILFCASV